MGDLLFSEGTTTNTNQGQQDLSDNPATMASYRAATMPDAQSRAAYIGRVTQTERVTIIGDDGTCFEKEVSFSINWDSISKILGLIQKRAGT